MYPFLPPRGPVRRLGPTPAGPYLPAEVRPYLRSPCCAVAGRLTSRSQTSASGRRCATVPARRGRRRRPAARPDTSGSAAATERTVSGEKRSARTECRHITAERLTPTYRETPQHRLSTAAAGSQWCWRICVRYTHTARWRGTEHTPNPHSNTAEETGERDGKTLHIARKQQ